MVVKYFDAFLNLIPLSFVLGFYVSIRHMFSRILNFLFVIVFSRKKNVFSVQITITFAIYNLYFDSKMKIHLEQIKANKKFDGEVIFRGFRIRENM